MQIGQSRETGIIDKEKQKPFCDHKMKYGNMFLSLKNVFVWRLFKPTQSVNYCVIIS